MNPEHFHTDIVILGLPFALDPQEVVARAVARLTRIFKLTELLHQSDSRSTHFHHPKDDRRRVLEKAHKMAA